MLQLFYRGNEGAAACRVVAFYCGKGVVAGGGGDFAKKAQAEGVGVPGFLGDEFGFVQNGGVLAGVFFAGVFVVVGVVVFVGTLFAE